MRKVQEQLLEYRRRKKPLTESERSLGAASTAFYDEQEHAESTSSGSYLDILAVDLLDVYPMRKWREFCAVRPLQCWVTTGSVWIAGQLLAAHAEFGFVYFVISLLLLLLLNLGVRKEGELSAYSVFNPNCERLPGQLTGEHFERDMLMRRN